MAKYYVTVNTSKNTTYEVEAETEENARNHYPNGKVTFSNENTGISVNLSGGRSSVAVENLFN